MSIPNFEKIQKIFQEQNKVYFRTGSHTVKHPKERGAACGGEKHMDVDLIFKIAAIGIIVAVLNQLLVRSGREEQALMTTLAGLNDTR